mmetsp:Transcript_45759/g.146855  ORF Transcript_45759/g.146855 Transcript_45759/m.146855 type:complete len:216 (+) Transcript_45759:274-921(+)
MQVVAIEFLLRFLLVFFPLLVLLHLVICGPSHEGCGHTLLLASPRLASTLLGVEFDASLALIVLVFLICRRANERCQNTFLLAGLWLAFVLEATVELHLLTVLVVVVVLELCRRELHETRGLPALQLPPGRLVALGGLGRVVVARGEADFGGLGDGLHVCGGHPVLHGPAPLDLLLFDLRIRACHAAVDLHDAIPISEHHPWALRCRRPLRRRRG